jgi:2-polyprenyl-3-methyl-5-hydroxy-6-metoxy-1,4-benzoquinol methylase
MPENDRTYDAKRLEVIRDCVARMPLGDEVAELGCGPGLITPLLLDRARQVTGFDIDAEVLDTARHSTENCTAAFVQHDLNQPLPEEFAGVFDSVVALEIIEHLEAPDAFVADICRVLRPGGQLLISTPNLSSPEALVGRYWAWRGGTPYRAWHRGHRNLFTARRLLGLLKQYGLAPRRVVGYHYGTDRLPLLGCRLRPPFKRASFWPLNRFGFNVLVQAELRRTT